MARQQHAVHHVLVHLLQLPVSHSVFCYSYGDAGNRFQRNQNNQYGRGNNQYGRDNYSRDNNQYGRDNRDTGNRFQAGQTQQGQQTPAPNKQGFDNRKLIPENRRLPAPQPAKAYMADNYQTPYVEDADENEEGFDQDDFSAFTADTPDQDDDDDTIEGDGDDVPDAHGMFAAVPIARL